MSEESFEIQDPGGIEDPGGIDFSRHRTSPCEKTLEEAVPVRPAQIRRRTGRLHALQSSCPDCGARLAVRRCRHCGRQSELKCTGCHGYRCTTPDCSARPPLWVFAGIALLLGLGIAYGRHVSARMDELVLQSREPEYLRSKRVLDQLAAYDAVGDTAAYLTDGADRIGTDPGPFRTDPYAILTKQIRQSFQDLDGPRPTFRQLGLGSVDLLDMVYGHLVPGQTLDLSMLIGRMQPVPARSGPRPGDLLVYLKHGQLHTAVVADRPGQIMYVADTFEQISLYGMDEAFFRSGLRAVFRPPSAPAPRS